MITLEEFDALPDNGLKHEIHKGELVTVGFPIVGHNRVVRRVYDTLGDFLGSNPIGEVFWTKTGYLLSGPGEPVTLVGRISPIYRGSGPPGSTMLQKGYRVQPN